MPSDVLQRLERALAEDRYRINKTRHMVERADVAELIEDYKALEFAYLALFNAPCAHCGLTAEQAKLKPREV